MESETKHFYMGIDPGVTGAIAVLDQNHTVVELMDCPKGGIPGMMDGIDELTSKVIETKASENSKLFACLEEVQGIPGMGSNSTFAFGVNFGAWQAIIKALGIPYILVKPQKWQKATLDGPQKKGTTKERSLATAQRLFPQKGLGLAKTNGRPDALNLARYAIQHFRGQ